MRKEAEIMIVVGELSALKDKPVLSGVLDSSFRFLINGGMLVGKRVRHAFPEDRHLDNNAV
jgi:hypothetical protein